MRIKAVSTVKMGKEMATHSRILAWRIPWTEEPGRLVHGVARVRHDLATRPPPILKKLSKHGLFVETCSSLVL